MFFRSFLIHYIHLKLSSASLNTGCKIASRSWNVSAGKQAPSGAVKKRPFAFLPFPSTLPVAQRQSRPLGAARAFQGWGRARGAPARLAPPGARATSRGVPATSRPFLPPQKEAVPLTLPAEKRGRWRVTRVGGDWRAECLS